MIQLRADQEDVRTKLRVALRSNTAVLAYAPTGFGKTVLAAALIKMILAAGKSVIFCVHRVDLITQTAKTFENFGIPFSYIAAGYHHNPYFKCQIASIATLKNRLGKYPGDYIFVDEAHLSAASGWAAVAAYYYELGAKLIGLSGTPERLDGKPLGDVWDVMVMGPSPRWLIENGHLSRYRAFAPAGIDMSGVHSRDGDFVTSEIDEIMAGRAVLAGAIRHWKKYAKGKRTIAFAPSVKRAEQLAAEFRANGIVAVALDGMTPQNDRRAAFNGFADRQIELIINCALFCEGFDLAAQVDRDVTIEAVLQYSPTQSLSKHLQQLGRGLRKKPEPAILLDLVGNLARPGLGLPDEEREWSLEGRKKADQETSTAICPRCFWSGPKTIRRCEDCGFEFPFKARETTGQGRLLDEVDGDLDEIDIEAVRKQRQERRREEAQGLARDLRAANGDVNKLDITPRAQGILSALIKQATGKGFKHPQQWAAHVLTARLAAENDRYGPSEDKKSA